VGGEGGSFRVASVFGYMGGLWVATSMYGPIETSSGVIFLLLFLNAIRVQSR